MDKKWAVIVLGTVGRDKAIAAVGIEPGDGNYAYPHFTTKEKAIATAERMANLCPGATYWVVEATHEVKTVTTKKAVAL